MKKNLFAQGAKASEYSIPLYAKLQDLRNTITRLFLLRIRVCGLFRMYINVYESNAGDFFNSDSYT